MTDGAVRKGEKRPRPCGLIYQQGTSGMIPEGLGMLNKKPAQGGKKYQGSKRRRGSRNGPKVEGLEHLAGIEPAYSGWKPDVITKLRQMQSGSGLCAEGF